MDRRLVMVLLTPCLLVPTGCLGPLAAMLARGPEAVARDMGQAAGYNAASSIAGSELGRDATAAADTMANIDRIKNEHPDALNAGELEELKRELEAELPPPGAEAEEGTDLAASEVSADHSLRAPPGAPADPHDRRARATARSGSDQVGQLSDGHIGQPAAGPRATNRLRIERPTPIDRRWRPTDPHRFTTPSQSSFLPEAPPATLESLTGEAYAPRDFSRVMLPTVGDTQPATVQP